MISAGARNYKKGSDKNAGPFHDIDIVIEFIS